MKKLKRLLIVIIAIILIAFITTTILNYTSGKKLKTALQQIKDKGEPLTLAEMAPPMIPEEENAAIEFEIIDILFNKYDDLLRQIYSRKFKKLIESYCTDPADTALKDEVVTKLKVIQEECADIYKHIDKATALGKCRFPIDYWAEDYNAISLARLETVRSCVRLLRLKALYLAATGKPDEALQSIQQMFTLSSYLKGETMLVGLYVQFAINYHAVDALENTLVIATPSIDACRKLIPDLIKSRNTFFLKRAFMGERTLGIQLFDLLRVGKKRYDDVLASIRENYYLNRKRSRYDNFKSALRPAFIFTYNEIEYLEKMARSIQCADKPYFEAKEELQDINKDIQNVSKLRPLVRAFALTPSGAMQHEGSTQARLSSAEIALRLLVYREDNGEFPETLEELNEDIPLDPFTGKSFLYRRGGEGFVIYSVGENLVDDGGIFEKDDKGKRPDIGFTYRYTAN